MKVNKFIEKDFASISPEATLGDLVKVISNSKRNIYPVIDKDNNFFGIIRLDDIRNIMFNPELYNTTYVRNLMIVPSSIVHPDESMDQVAKKFQHSGKYNLAVVKEGKYLGFISRANVFSSYRKILKEFSDD